MSGKYRQPQLRLSYVRPSAGEQIEIWASGWRGSIRLAEAVCLLFANNIVTLPNIQNCRKIQKHLENPQNPPLTPFSICWALSLSLSRYIYIYIIYIYINIRITFLWVLNFGQVGELLHRFSKLYYYAVFFHTGFITSPSF